MIALSLLVRYLLTAICFAARHVGLIIIYLIVSESSFQIISIYCSIFSAQHQIWRISVAKHPQTPNKAHKQNIEKLNELKVVSRSSLIRTSSTSNTVHCRWNAWNDDSNRWIADGKASSIHTDTQTAYERKTEKVFVDSTLYPIDTA